MSKKKREKTWLIDCQAANDGRTKQAFKDECDIHKILKQFKRTGLVTHLESRPPQFVDITAMPDYRTALNAVKATEELFYQLPAKVRLEQFGNDPALFLDYCVDPSNESELQDLGLLPRKEAEAVSSLSANGEASAKPVSGAAEDAPEGA